MVNPANATQKLHKRTDCADKRMSLGLTIGVKPIGAANFAAQVHTRHAAGEVVRFAGVPVRVEERCVVLIDVEHTGTVLPCKVAL